jgi:ATP-binding cassette subfamily B multidrug efflux pump
VNTAMAPPLLPAAEAPPARLFRQLAGLVRPWRGLLALMALAVLVAAVLELAPPLVMKRIVDTNLTPRRADGLLPLALLYFGATAGVHLLNVVYYYLAPEVVQGALHALRVRLFAHLQRLPVSYYDHTPLGDTISRCTADVETLDTLFTTGVATLMAEMVRLLTTGAAMVVLSPVLALAAALVMPPLVLVTRFFQVRVRDAEREGRRAVGLLNTHLQESLAGVEVIRAFRREDAFVARFRSALARTLAATNRSTFYNSMYPPVTGIMAAMATALLLWIGARNAFATLGISLGTLTAFVLLFQRFFKPIIALGDEWQTVQSALSGAERIFAVLALPTEESEVRGPKSERVALEPSFSAHRSSLVAPPAIALGNVVFGYLPGRPVLRGVSLSIAPGEHVALVGRTGAGKSSTLHLLGGLYEPWAGAVRVAGLDPRALTEEERRHVIGIVPQVVQLFTGTVSENLTLHDPSVPRDAVERAAAIAGVDALVRSLPHGYDTLLSGSGRGGGAQLSAGQRQLLALARALVWEPAVLLLDEATAAVDGASEAAFRAALHDAVLGNGRAVLTVAHRLATAREAHRVIVMDAGRIVEEGPPDDLARSGGRFAALLELEAAGWDWRE